MKKTRLLIAVLVMLVAASGYAQDSYRQALKQYLVNFGPENQIKTALHDINESLFVKSGNVDMEVLTERYIKEVFIDQMTDMVEPMMKERNVTEADMKNIIAMVATPEGKAFLTHQNEWSEKLNEYMSQLKDGGELESVQVNPDIDADYAARFQKMWKESRMEEKSRGLFEGLPLKEMADFGKYFDKYKTWFTDNFSTLALNAAYGTLTLKDLDIGVKLYTNESYRKVTDTSGMNVFDLMGASTDMIIQYIDWMESQGAQPSDKLNSFKMFKNLMNSTGSTRSTEEGLDK